MGSCAEVVVLLEELESLPLDVFADVLLLLIILQSFEVRFRGEE